MEADEVSTFDVSGIGSDDELDELQAFDASQVDLNEPFHRDPTPHPTSLADLPPEIVQRIFTLFLLKYQDSRSMWKLLTLSRRYSKIAVKVLYQSVKLKHSLSIERLSDRLAETNLGRSIRRLTISLPAELSHAHRAGMPSWNGVAASEIRAASLATIWTSFSILLRACGPNLAYLSVSVGDALINPTTSLTRFYDALAALSGLRSLHITAGTRELRSDIGLLFRKGAVSWTNIEELRVITGHQTMMPTPGAPPYPFLPTLRELWIDIVAGIGPNPLARVLAVTPHLHALRFAICADSPDSDETAQALLPIIPQLEMLRIGLISGCTTSRFDTIARQILPPATMLKHLLCHGQLFADVNDYHRLPLTLETLRFKGKALHLSMLAVVVAGRLTALTKLEFRGVPAVADRASLDALTAACAFRGVAMTGLSAAPGPS